MTHIYNVSVEACNNYNLGYDLVSGANIAGFERVAEAMYKKIKVHSKENIMRDTRIIVI